MNIKKTSKFIGKTLLWILGIWIGILMIVQIILLPPIFTPLANSLANKFVNADVYIGRASGSVIRHFPRISFSFEDLEITYPHERFDSLARAGAQHELLYSGCGETVDTLASIGRVSASISLHSLLWGELKIPDVELENPVIYAHSYDGEHANWDIFGSSEPAQPADTTSTQEPQSGGGGSGKSLNIVVNRVSITGKPRIVYTDSQDSLFVRVGMNEAGFDGHFETESLHKLMAKAYLDNLCVNGKYGRDTLDGTINHIRVTPHQQHMHLDINANASLPLLEDGALLPIPLDFSGDVSIPHDDGTAISLHNIKTSIGTIPGEGNLDVVLHNDSTVIDGYFNIHEHQIQFLLNRFMAAYVPDLEGIRTDTKVSVYTKIKGAFNYMDGTMPEVSVKIDIPDSKLFHKTFPDKIDLGMNADMLMDRSGQISANISRAKLKTYGLDLNSMAGTHPFEDDDREIMIDGDLKVSLDSLRSFLPDTLNLIANGGFAINLHGSAKLSDIGLYDFSKAGLQGRLYSDSMVLKMPDDSIDVSIGKVDIRLLPEYITTPENPDKPLKLMGISGTVSSADINYRNSVIFNGKKFDFSAKNSSESVEENDNEVRYLGGRINAGLLYLEDSEGTSIKLEETANRFGMFPDRGNTKVPILSLSNKNKRITYVTSDNRVILTDSDIMAKASLNSFERAAKRNAMLDSLAQVYPTVPRDSLFRHARAQKTSKVIESYDSEEDFKDSDIKLDINSSVKKYFREWDMSGNVNVRTGIIITPYFPLRNIIRGMTFRFTNDKAAIDSLKIVSGESEIAANGSISNLKRVMLKNGTIKLGINISSSSINANELLSAYSLGSQYQPDTGGSSNEELPNAEFFKKVTCDTIQTVQSTSSLVVIPSNISAELGIDLSGVRYKDLNISKINTDIVVKERCAQITGASFESNMGNAYLDAFYATRNKQDIKTGFCLDLKDVTSERVISLMPQISSVMPMIESIKGKLHCEVAATAELDTTMSIKMQTLKGIARLDGKNLSISDDKVFTSVAKKLMFKNKKNGHIEELMIEGVIEDNSLRIYPFILSVDRYMLAISGIQNADMSYRHHISVLRSPLLIRLGLNLIGPDYDHMKYKLGKAKYRAKKMPSFTAVIDQMKNDLRYSIYNIFKEGVESAMTTNNMPSLIERHEDEIGYINAADLELEMLSEDELSAWEESENANAAMEEAMKAAADAVQKVLNNNKNNNEQSGIH